MDSLTDLDIGAFVKNEMHKAYGRQYAKGNYIKGRGSLPDYEIETIGGRVRAALSPERNES